MDSRYASSSASPASSLITWLIRSAHFRSAASSRSRTAGSLVKSDSKTSRNVPLCSATYPKYAANVALTRCRLSVVERIASGTASISLLHALVEQRQVELLLAGEVLVEDRLADPGPLRDLVHRRRVVAAGDEDLHGRVEQLAAAGKPREPGSPRASG